MRRSAAVKTWLCAAAAVACVVGIALFAPRRPEAPHAVFKCGVLINPADGSMARDVLIDTAQGRIAAVGPASAAVIPPGALVVDFSTKYVIPGLIDTHGHLYTRGNSAWTASNPYVPVLYLAAGVTSVGVPGSMDFAGDVALKRRVDAGELPGPRLFLAGDYIDTQPTISWMVNTPTPDKARLRVTTAAMNGAPAVKVYANVSEQVLKTTIKEAHARSMRVWAHVSSITARRAIELGVDQIFHGVGAMSDGRRPGLRADARHPEAWLRSTIMLDLGRPEIQDMFAAAARRRVVLTPTAVVSEALDPRALRAHRLQEQKPLFSPAAWDAMEVYRQPSTGTAWRVALARRELVKNREFIRRAYLAGCLLSAGTDYVLPVSLPGWTLWREMEIFEESGLPAMEVLKAATWNGSYALGASDRMGSIEPGKLADFVALDANPLADVSNVRKVYRVVKNGVVYDRAALLKAIAGRVN